ncbi:MAG: hypothetical protein GYA30_03155 [Chloroflexi bacterium]|nr:hypothetical protein [Chloroflexota bacterium]OQB00274.1 MAG: hypothetical protein BWY25_01864 [Chloroflexi bacterium ADurb.Bin222]
MALKPGPKHLMVFDSDDDPSIFVDFAMYEIRQRDGKNIVQRYAEEKGVADAIERELLAAMVQAHPGLYTVRQILRDKGQTGAV